ncbi:unnamed protein product [Alopecurus aequalis]
MSGGGEGGNEEAEVVHMEDAVKLLVEHLVRPVLPRRAAQDLQRHMTPEKQRAVAQQVHTAAILYNYYHRKMFPQLAFAEAKRFFMCAALSVGEDLLPYLSIVHDRENNSGKHGSLSVTDKAAIQACDIAAELDATKGYPDMDMWPIAKVAVLLLDMTRKKCLIEYSADTKGVWSIIEKEYDAEAGISHSTNQPAGHESTNKRAFGALDGPYMLQRLAISEVQRRTGMEGSDLLVLDEKLAYSLSKERTTTKLFIVQYKQTTKGKLVELPLEELINSMTGPVFVNDPFPNTTSVVEYYHILPYKEILFEVLHRKWPADPQHGSHSVIDEKLEEQAENSTPMMQKRMTKVPTPKQNKRAIKAADANSNQNSSISKHKKSSKRKAEASRATAAVGPDGGNPIIENKSLIVPDVETSGLNAKTTAAVSGGPIFLQSGGQVDKNKTQKKLSVSANMAQDIVPAMAPFVNPAIKNGALEHQNMEVTENSGGVTENNDDQISDLLQSIQKIRDEILHKELILQERSIQCDMDIQTILNEGKMTPKARSIVDKYRGSCSSMTEVANSSCSGDGGQTMSSKRKRLKEILQGRNKCQELDEICNKCEWILPRYVIVPSVADGMFRASVHLTCPDFEMSIAGGPRPTPREARYSAAANMMVELQKKAEEED